MVDSVLVADGHVSVFKNILSLNLNSCPVNVYLASADKDDIVPKFEQLLMTRKLADGFRDIIVNILEKYQKDTGANNTLFSEYLIESVLDENEIEYFDLAERKSIAEQIEPLKLFTDIETFSEEKSFIEGIRFYVIIAQPEQSEPIYFYHVYTRRRILKRSGLCAFLGSKGEYDRVEEKYITFDESIDCLSYNGVMFVINKSNFQTMFRYLEEVRTVARETLNTINSNLPIQNFDELVEACEGNLAMLRKLKKIATKPYIHNLKMNDVKKIIALNHLQVEIVEVNGQEKILFNPKAKAKDKYALLRIFNDDYLSSLMTDKNYEVTGKREVSKS